MLKEYKIFEFPWSGTYRIWSLQVIEFNIEFFEFSYTLTVSFRDSGNSCPLPDSEDRESDVRIYEINLTFVGGFLCESLKRRQCEVSNFITRKFTFSVNGNPFWRKDLRFYGKGREKWWIVLYTSYFYILGVKE